MTFIFTVQFCGFRDVVIEKDAKNLADGKRSNSGLCRDGTQIGGNDP